MGKENNCLIPCTINVIFDFERPYEEEENWSQESHTTIICTTVKQIILKL